MLIVILRVTCFTSVLLREHLLGDVYRVIRKEYFSIDYLHSEDMHNSCERVHTNNNHHHLSIAMM